MSRMADIHAAPLVSAEPDPMDESSTRVELDLHSVDGSLDSLRRAFERDPWLAGAYRDDLSEIAAEFSALARTH